MESWLKAPDKPLPQHHHSWTQSRVIPGPCQEVIIGCYSFFFDSCPKNILDAVALILP